MTEWLKVLTSTLTELDTEAGIKYCCDSEPVYQQVLMKYASKDYTELLEQYYTAQDWDNYRTTIHGLKSTSLTIGLLQLSEDAKALEYAARDKDISYLSEHHCIFLDRYQMVVSKIKSLSKPV